VFLTFEEAVSLLPTGDTIHTFTNPGMGLLVGADWTRDEVLDLLRSCPDAECAEVTGPQAQAMQHGLAVHRAGHPLLYIEASTWPDEQQARVEGTVAP
jgi:hypothetical protein